MASSSSLQSVIDSTAQRRRLLRAWNGAWWGLLIGLASCSVELILWRWVGLPVRIVSFAAIQVIGGTLVGFLVGGWKRESEVTTARWLDEALKLQERLSTAMELSAPSRVGTSTPPDWRELVVRDAEAAAAQVRPSVLIPWRLPGVARWVGVVSFALAGLVFLPTLNSPLHRKTSRDAQIMKEAGAQLAGLVKRQLEQRAPVMEPPKRALNEVADLAARLSSAKLTREDALKDLAKVTDKVNQEASELQRNAALKKMVEAAKSPDKGAQTGNAALQKRMEELSKQLGEQASKPETTEPLKKGLEKLQEQAKSVSGENTPAAAEQREKLAQQASQLARQAESMGVPMPSLEAAAAALSSAQIDNFFKDLKVAEMDLNKMSEMAKALAEMKQQSESMGKDLAEQLKNGQVEAAIQSLSELRKQLAAGKLTPEQVAQISRALSPAKPYGKVQDHLQKALAALQKASGKPVEKSNGSKDGKAGDQGAPSDSGKEAGEAGSSLAAAQKELQDLMNQLGDAQAMQASLESLQKAQMSIGNSMLWGQCDNPGSQPRAGQTSKGGKGVGTWASSSAWSLPDHVDDLWDNSGVKRSDQAGKGQTDRSDALPNGLVPTKIKGEMQPGGAMPSITLKGLSLKGTSKVSYAEAVAAAQVDAQSALSQDQVPKAYQNSVRDYFDDLKK